MAHWLALTNALRILSLVIDQVSDKVFEVRIETREKQRKVSNHSVVDGSLEEGHKRWGAQKRERSLKL